VCWLIFTLFALSYYFPAIDATFGGDGHGDDKDKDDKCCCDVYGFNEVSTPLFNWSCTQRIIFDFPLTVRFSDGTTLPIPLHWIININDADFRTFGVGTIPNGGPFGGYLAEFRLNLQDYNDGCCKGVGISEVSGTASLFLRSASGNPVVYGKKGWRYCTGSAVITFDPAIQATAVTDPSVSIADHTIIVFDKCVGTCFEDNDRHGG